VKTAVVGHVEWCDFARVPRVPRTGEILETDEDFSEPAGGGAVAAVQLARLAGGCTFFTALGDDDLADRVSVGLTNLGVTVEAVRRPGKQTRRAFVYLDDGGERTITTLGERLHAERADDLPWDELEGAGGVYFVAGDAEALRAARSARAVVATARIIELLESAGVALDAVVGSGRDDAERYRPIEPAPRYVVATAGSHGGSWSGAEGREGNWAAAPLPGPVADAYGCGDSFAAGLTFALGEGFEIDGALALAARCGAVCMTGHGPYENQLTGADLRDH
jgi:ribokinase